MKSIIESFSCSNTKNHKSTLNNSSSISPPETYTLQERRDKFVLKNRISRSIRYIVIESASRTTKKKKYQDFTIFLKTHFHRAGFPSILYKTRQPSYPRRFNTGLSSRTNRHNPDIL